MGLAVVVAAVLLGPDIIERLARWFGVTQSTEDYYLAILPFTPIGDEDEDTALSDGLTEILTAKLTGLTGSHGFQVAPAHLTRGSPPPGVEEIGKRLGVDLAIVGSFQRHGEDLRVTINLVDVQRDRQMDAEVITASLVDPFMLQDRIVEAAIEHDRHYAEAHAGLGQAYESLSRFDAAEETYLRAVSLRPHYWATHNWLGAFYAYQGRFEEATGCFERVVELVPKSYRGYQNLGGVHLLLGQFEQATPVLEQSVSLRPSPHGYSNLATAYFGRRDFEQSVRYNLQAVELGRDDIQVWGNLGEAYYWAGGHENEFREAHDRALELAGGQLEVNPENATVLGEMAKFHAMLGDAEQARTHLGRALELGRPDAELDRGQSGV